MRMQMCSLILFLPMKLRVSGRPGLPIYLKYICDLKSFLTLDPELPRLGLRTLYPPCACVMIRLLPCNPGETRVSAFLGGCMFCMMLSPPPPSALAAC